MEKRKSRSPWVSLIIVFLAVFFVGLLIVSCVSLVAGPRREFSVDGNVALINVEGEIMGSDEGGFFSSGASADELVGFIDEAAKDDRIEAILIRINSPGGAPVASEEIAAALLRANKTTVALIRDQGTSGAYWIASAADSIVASPVSITGSIGVIGSSLEFSKFMEKYGIGYEKLIAGQYKDIGIPFRNLTPEERVILQERLDLMHEYFIAEVAKNRDLPIEHVRAIANGLFYTGAQAKDLGLVDVLGGEEAAKEEIKRLAGIDDIELVEFHRPVGLFDLFASASSQAGYAMGKGIGSELVKDQFSVRT